MDSPDKVEVLPIYRNCASKEPAWVILDPEDARRLTHARLELSPSGEVLAKLPALVRRCHLARWLVYGETRADRYAKKNPRLYYADGNPLNVTRQNLVETEPVGQ